jgi:hypothetical protein
MASITHTYHSVLRGLSAFTSGGLYTDVFCTSPPAVAFVPVVTVPGCTLVADTCQPSDVFFIVAFVDFAPLLSSAFSGSVRS